MTTSFHVKDPNSFLPYTIDWAKPGASWLLSGDTILTSTFTVVDVGITLGTGQFESSFTPTKTTVWVAGGTLPEHRVINHITTAQGLEEDQTIVFLIDQK